MVTFKNALKDLYPRKAEKAMRLLELIGGGKHNIAALAKEMNFKQKEGLINFSRKLRKYGFIETRGSDYFLGERPFDNIRGSWDYFRD
jgi:hypothetical protein